MGGDRDTRRLRRALALGVVLGLMAGASSGGDGAVRTPHHAVFRGCVEDLDDVADLLERLARMPGRAEPELRRARRGEGGWGFTVVVPDPPPASAAAEPRRHRPARPPPFAAPPIARAIFRLLVPPFT